MPTPEILVQCSLCKRAVWESHTNTTGRCVYCAGEQEPLGGAPDAEDEDEPVTRPKDR